MGSDATEPVIRDSPGDGRFEVHIGSDLAGALHYDRRDGALVMTKTEVGDSFAGCGVGSGLVEGALDAGRRQGVRVVPLCPFISAYIERNPDYADLVDGELHQLLIR